MKEVGTINRDLAAIISQQGHGDLLMVTDAGFAIPKELKVLDLSLDENKPTVPEVLETLKKVFSVEKMIMAKETEQCSPTLFKNISKMWGDDIPVETMPHSELKEMSRKVKAVIRTGDFTAFGNVILVSGCGTRWYVERKA